MHALNISLCAIESFCQQSLALPHVYEQLRIVMHTRQTDSPNIVSPKVAVHTIHPPPMQSVQPDPMLTLCRRA